MQIFNFKLDNFNMYDFFHFSFFGTLFFFFETPFWYDFLRRNFAKCPPKSVTKKVLQKNFYVRFLDIRTFGRYLKTGHSCPVC